jgi:hypothetical protein
MADEWKKSQDKTAVYDDLAIRRLNAENARRKLELLEQQQYEEMAAQGFISPEKGVQLASMTQGFDANTGTNAGGLAFDQGVDFGANVYVPHNEVPTYQPQVSDPTVQSTYDIPELKEMQYFSPEKHEQMFKDRSNLISMAQQMAAAGVDIEKPDWENPDAVYMIKKFRDAENRFKSEYSQRQMGYEAEKSLIEKGRRLEAPGNMGTEFTTMRQSYDPTLVNDAIDDFNLSFKEYNDKPLTDARRSDLLGGAKDLGEAIDNGTGRVGRWFKGKVERLSKNGLRANEIADLKAEVMRVGLPGYDPTKDKDRALDWSKENREKDKYSRGKNIKTAAAADLYDTWKKVVNNKQISGLKTTLGANNVEISGDVMTITMPADKVESVEMGGIKSEKYGKEIVYTFDLKDDETSEFGFVNLMANKMGIPKKEAQELHYNFGEAKRGDRELEASKYDDEGNLREGQEATTQEYFVSNPIQNTASAVSDIDNDPNKTDEEKESLKDSEYQGLADEIRKVVRKINKGPREVDREGSIVTIKYDTGREDDLVYDLSDQSQRHLLENKMEEYFADNPNLYTSLKGKSKFEKSRGGYFGQKGTVGGSKNKKGSSNFESGSKTRPVKNEVPKKVDKFLKNFE